MRFLSRAIIGYLLLALTLAGVTLSVIEIKGAFDARAEREERRPGQRERVFAITPAIVETAPLAPRISSFAEVKTAQRIDMRARIGGTVVELHPAFQTGGAIEAGALIARIDPTELQAARDLAALALEDAQAELRQAREAVRLSLREEAAAEERRALLAQALERAQSLKSRGAGTSASVEAAELSLSTAVQNLLAREASRAAAEARAEKADVTRKRMELNLREAERRLSETSLYAPFSGRLAQTGLLIGAQISPGEVIARLIDLQSLEISFRLSHSEIAKLSAPSGSKEPIIGAWVSVHLPQGEALAAQVVRGDAEVAAGQTGRQFHAKLMLPDTMVSALLPGDFVTISIEGMAFEEATRLPAQAINHEGAVLVVGPDERLMRALVTVHHIEGDMALVSGLEAGMMVVAAPNPQLGAGVKVRVLGARE